MDELIKKGESEILEFKETLKVVNELGETVSAFSNTKQGTILIGVSDSGKVIGASIGKNTLEELANYLKRNTDPQIYPSLKVEEIENKTIILIQVSESKEKPVFFKKHAYKRVGKTNLELSSSEIRKLAKETGEKIYWDGQICERAGLDDIDEEKIRWFVKEGRRQHRLRISEEASITDILTHLDMIGDRKVSNSAILLFGKRPQKFFMQSEIKGIALSTTEFVKPYNTYQTYSGNLFEQVDKSTAFVLENIRRPLWIEQGEVAARHPYELPQRAIREAIVNAIVHRDYNSPSKIQIRVFPDRVEIWNPGQLPSQLKINDLKKSHPSIPHNPLLFRQFYRVSYVEDVGGGTIDIIMRCKEVGLIEPKFEQKMGNFIITVKRSVLTDEYLESIGLNERQKKAVKYLEKYGKITRVEYEKLWSVSGRTANRELGELFRKKLIEKKGKGPEICYILARYGEIWRDKKDDKNE